MKQYDVIKFEYNNMIMLNFIIICNSIETTVDGETMVGVDDDARYKVKYRRII